MKRRPFILAAMILLAVVVAGGVPRGYGGEAQERLAPREVLEEIQRLRAEIAQRGYLHRVGPNPAMLRSREELCGLRLPPNWRLLAGWDDMGLQEGGRLGGVGLPERFDWREQLTAPPVRNQGGCGSCWAFATVGPLEFAISRFYGAVEDLSEQFLVSCNPWGYGCNGGWWAFDMFVDPGAVLEADFPYEARDVPCGGPYEYPYQIDGWYYIGSGWGVPEPEQIKQAIYTYGPVAAAVYVGPQFQAYTGGVFAVQEAPSSSAVNHGVVLVGWDDTTPCGDGRYGVWVMRNSWGPWWGEEGYMRICYGTSNIGYAASYIELEAPPPAYTLQVFLSGDGTGTVTSTPEGIDCGGSCEAVFVEGTQVTLTAHPDSDSVFDGWSGGGCSGTGPCTMTLAADTSVTATFRMTLFSPVADFTCDSSGGDAPHEVRFTDLSQNGPTAWLWDFGDGETSTLQHPVHVYRQDGTYTVTLTVWNEAGSDTRTEPDLVVVEACPDGPARIGSAFYGTLQEGYADAQNGDVLLAQGVDFQESLLLDQPKRVVLDGGWDCGYQEQAFSTRIKGAIIAQGGTLEIKGGVEIQAP